MVGVGVFRGMSPGTKIATGTYTGNDAANRAIAHGLGKLPSVVLYFRDDSGDCYMQLQGVGAQKSMVATGAVTAMTATAFYVGLAGTFAGNISPATYTFVAIG